jgi:ubiquinone/menaquinone biosynthesis C-methylase UbiE
LSDPSCETGQCDIFEFMARHVGLTVIHPGGLAATSWLAETCGIGVGDRVLDLGCGKGTTAIYLARKYSCDVTGIDLSDELVAQAVSLARRARMSHRIQFQVADAQLLPFRDGEFDVVISQAVLVLVRDKSRVIREALRVTKPGGRVGWLELSWQRAPSSDFLQSVSDVLCAYCMQNVETFQDWQSRFREAGLADLSASLFPLPVGRFHAMLRDEGLRNTLGVMLRTLLSRSIRARTQKMSQFFETHADLFGYGIYVGRKPGL